MILSDAGIRRAVAEGDIALDPMPESARSSLARLGLMVHLTAPTIHAGFNGNITLEVINHGPFHLKLVPKTIEACVIAREPRACDHDR
ncbi:MAG: hypothetical protein Q7J25_05380 [Vicinamibacterales bacterium]|nr:hypothetical protein [Vicinamibacterales bacterium]